MNESDDGASVRYPRVIRLVLLGTLLLHIAGGLYLCVLRLSTIKLHRIYYSLGNGGLDNMPMPGWMLVPLVVFEYALFIGFLIWLGFQWFYGDDGRAGKLYAVTAFVAALVVVGRYWGREAAEYSNSLQASLWMALWFLGTAVLATIFAIRVNRFRSQIESNEIKQMLQSEHEQQGRDC